MPELYEIDIPANAQLRRDALNAQLRVAEAQATAVGEEWARARDELQQAEREILAMCGQLALNPALALEMADLGARRAAKEAGLATAQGKRQGAQREVNQIRTKLLALDEADDGMGKIRS